MSGWDPLRLFIFVSAQNPQLFGFTRDQTGGNLPPNYGPWLSSAGFTMQGTISAGAGEISNAIESAIASRGYYLSRADGRAW